MNITDIIGDSPLNPNVSDITGREDYDGVSLVDYLKSKGMDSSPGARMKLASEFGIPNYRYLPIQNTEILNRLISKTAKGAMGEGIPKHTSVVDYLKSKGMPSSEADRKKLADELGIVNYIGSPSKNTELLSKLQFIDQQNIDSNNDPDNPNIPNNDEPSKANPIPEEFDSRSMAYNKANRKLQSHFFNKKPEQIIDKIMKNAKDPTISPIEELVQGYTRRVEELKSKGVFSEEEASTLMKDFIGYMESVGYKGGITDKIVDFGKKIKGKFNDIRDVLNEGDFTQEEIEQMCNNRRDAIKGQDARKEQDAIKEQEARDARYDREQEASLREMEADNLEKYGRKDITGFTEEQLRDLEFRKG